MQTNSEIDVLINNNFPNNEAKLITAEKAREVLEAINGSFLNLKDDIHLVGLHEFNGQTYSSGGAVIKDNIIYKAVSTVTSNTWVPSEWQQVRNLVSSSSGNTLDDYILKTNGIELAAGKKTIVLADDETLPALVSGFYIANPVSVNTGLDFSYPLPQKGFFMNFKGDTNSNSFQVYYPFDGIKHFFLKFGLNNWIEFNNTESKLYENGVYDDAGTVKVGGEFYNINLTGESTSYSEFNIDNIRKFSVTNTDHVEFNSSSFITNNLPIVTDAPSYLLAIKDNNEVVKISSDDFGGGGGDTIYDLASPATVSVGGLPAGYVLSGKTQNQIFQQMLVVYQSPAFTAWNISGQTNPLEVGQAFGGNKTFVWSTSNSGNVTPNTVSILDVNTSTNLLLGGANDGSEIIDIGTKTNTSPISQTFRITAANTQSVNFSSNYTVTSKYPIFFGKVNGGPVPAGVNRPVIDQSLINGSSGAVTKSMSIDAAGTLNITFGSTGQDYIWFAVPSTAPNKTIWYQSALNTGNIGGAVSVGANLFPTPTTISINSPTGLWSGVSYKIYLSNYQNSFTTNLELRNS